MSQAKIITTRLAVALLAISTTGGAAFAQASDPPDRPKRTQDPESYYRAPASMHGKTVVLPIGSTFEGRIDTTISSEHSHTGQRFNIVIDSPVLINGIDVVIPTGSVIIGEVVEAVPASNVPRQKWEDKRLVHGKLRVQISGLRLPDGNMYPLVAGLQGEVTDKNHEYLNTFRNPLGTSVGYMGTAAGFEAANTNRSHADKMRLHNRNLGPQVMPKKEFMKDEVLGTGVDRIGPDFSHIRSLVLKKRDYWIYNGSPLTVKTTAPFKIGMSHPGGGVSVGSLGDEPRDPQFPPPSSDREPTNGTPGGGFQAPAPVNVAPPPNRGAVPPDSF